MSDFHDELESQNPRKSLVAWYDWVTRGECHCCFPEWEYEDISVQDVWTWESQIRVTDLGVAFDNGRIEEM